MFRSALWACAALLALVAAPELSAAPSGPGIPTILPPKPVAGINASSRVTVFGTASGVLDPEGAYRYAVKYASASRWAPSTLVNTWSLPYVAETHDPNHPLMTLSLVRNGASDPASLPLACPQVGLPSSAYSEDCLSMLLYVPPSLKPASQAPVLVWCATFA